MSSKFMYVLPIIPQNANVSQTDVTILSVKIKRYNPFYQMCMNQNLQTFSINVCKNQYKLQKHMKMDVSYFTSFDVIANNIETDIYYVVKP